MIDHVTLNVADLAPERAFYEQALRPVGYELAMDFPEWCGFASDGVPNFFISHRGEPSAPVHIAFVAPDRAAVEAFHEAALAAGGQDNGPPGIRQVYHEHYFGAYVLDPEGNNVEAVTHKPS